jgi:hypothetical protein
MYESTENLISPESNKEKRIAEIESYIKGYFKKYKVGHEASGYGSTQDTKLAASFWSRFDKNWEDDIGNILQSKLKEKNLVDLGFGKSDENIPWYIKLPVKKYTAVDIDTPYPATKDAIRDLKNQGIDASIVNSDLLLYVANLPDESSNFFLSAIDHDVILDEQYWKYLAEEIYRSTEEGGIVIEGGMVSLHEYLDNKRWKTLIDDGRGEFAKRIFEKIG